MMNSKTSKWAACQRLRAAHGSVSCPTCNGTGKLKKGQLQVTRWTWKRKDRRKAKPNKEGWLSSHIIVTTIKTPNAGTERRAGEGA
jgi:hypothetical protein